MYVTYSSLMQAQNKKVGQKLGIATAAMFTMPIAAFYLGLELFANKQNPDNWAGGLAILVTNIVVAGYVISAFSEPDEDFLKKEERSGGGNDEDAPRVGAFKKRTD
jgi:hypothetical protein